MELARKAGLTLIAGRAASASSLAGTERIVFDQDPAYVEEESAKSRRKGSGGDD